MPPTYCPCPRPILKRPSADKQHSAQPLYYSSPPNPQNDLLHIDPSVLGQPTVRFPPQATLVTRTFLAHPKSLYDRSPIVVAPNECRMPERGCPGRTYLPAPAASPSSSSASSSSKSSRGRDHSPARRGRSPRARNGAMPPLVPDLTSSSDESDGLVSPPVETDSAIDPFVKQNKQTSSLRSTPAASPSHSTALSIPASAPASTGLSISPPELMSLSNPTSPVALAFRSPRARSRSRSTSRERGREVETASATPEKKKKHHRKSRRGEDGEIVHRSSYKGFNDCSFGLSVNDSGCLGGF